MGLLAPGCPIPFTELLGATRKQTQRALSRAGVSSQPPSQEQLGRKTKAICPARSAAVTAAGKMPSISQLKLATY